ncbi:hypothetical protein K8352_08920 [Flavobacteriaceae bacterium F89]|uniref:Uncharacterized protein n=1 Tax=Cerina litoralis TaxID=2874477 RepID=A0AAE3EVB7_9FLAO|nr:hypothetical protein [Cerina litoralis]
MLGCVLCCVSGCQRCLWSLVERFSNAVEFYNKTPSK